MPEIPVGQKLYRVLSKFWTENSGGEVTEGPWINRGAGLDWDAALALKVELNHLYRDFDDFYGVWVKIEEEVVHA